MEFFGTPVERGTIIKVTDAGARVASHDRPGYVTMLLKPMFRKSMEVGWPVFFVEYENGNGLVLSHQNPEITRDEAAEGIPGPDGKSAYEVWLEAGNTGTVEDYLESLRGPQGPDGLNGSPDTPAQVLGKLRAAGGLAANPKLLINRDFQVWQRGTVFYTLGSNQYFADRWRFICNTGTGYVDRRLYGDRYITQFDIGTDKTWCGIVQSIEDVQNYYSGKTITITIYTPVPSTIYAIQASVGAVSNYATLTPLADRVIGTVTVPPFTGGVFHLTINFVASQRYPSIFAVDVEEGLISTPFVPRPYEEELAMCRRYYQRFSWRNDCAYMVTANSLYFLVPYFTPMRTSTPTLAVSGVGIYLKVTGVLSGFTFSITPLNGRQAYLQASKTAHGNSPNDIWLEGIVTADAEIY